MKTLQDILSETLQPLLGKVDYLLKLNEVWSALIKKEWAALCRIGKFEQGTLLLYVPNGAWATRIRYDIPEIKQLLCAHPAFSTLKKIECHILLETKIEEKEAEPRVLSQKASDILRDAAKQAEHPNVKRALVKLARKVVIPA